MLNQLNSYLNENKLDNYRYLLVDPLKPVKEDELLALVNIKEVFPANEVQVVLRSDLYYDPDYCPHLILLAKPNEDIDKELLQLTLDRSNKEKGLYKHYICGWLSSELAIEELAIKLVEYGDFLGNKEQPNNKNFLPFFEHIRLQLISEYLSFANISLIDFDFVSNYIYMNYYGELINIIPNKTTPEFNSLYDIFLQKALRAQNMPKLIYGLADIWQENASNIPDNILFICAEKIIEAKNLGLKDHEDLLAYSLYSLLANKELMIYSEFSDAVKLAIEGVQKLNHSLSDFSPETWFKMGIEVSSHNHIGV